MEAGAFTAIALTDKSNTPSAAPIPGWRISCMNLNNVIPDNGFIVFPQLFFSVYTSDFHL